MDSTIKTLVQAMSWEEKLRLTTGLGLWRTAAFPHLGIPSIIMSDGTNGIRFQIESGGESSSGFIDGSEGFDTAEALAKTHKATCFPSGSTISCSWDTDLIRQTGQAIADECHTLGISLLLGPGVNIRRHPFTGRNFEYYSEDPCLSGDLGAAVVSGLASKGIGACPKHFVCHTSDDFRTRVDARIDERALREIYLSSFERVVRKGRPKAVMTAYNKVNGEYASENHHILRDILKGEWGFEGMTISDWGGVPHPLKAHDGGLDLHMPESHASLNRLRQAYERGELSLEALDERVERILSVVFSLQGQQPRQAAADFTRNHELAREAAIRSLVLLKNEGSVLPLKPGTKVCVVGTLAVDPLYQGTGCAIINAAAVDSPLGELQSAAGDDFSIDYLPGYNADLSRNPTYLAEAVERIQEADTVIIFAGCRLPEESDTYNRTDLSIEPAHSELIEELSGRGTPVVVVLASGDAVVMPWIDHVQGLLYTGFAGEGLGWALADILLGMRSPSGKLSATFPARVEDTPVYGCFPGNRFQQDYGESVFVGYRYYDYRGTEPQFPFGFGLSYTNFEYSHMVLTPIASGTTDVVYQIRADIRNTGNSTGDEIVQLYVGQVGPEVARPVRELKGFTRVSLEPGETESVEFQLEYRDFAYYDELLGSWDAPSGTYTISLASSSRDIRLTAEIAWINPVEKYPLLTTESGFTEIFRVSGADDLVFSFLLDHGLIGADEDRSLVKASLLKTFWGIYSYIDMNTDGSVSYEDVEDLVRSLNRE